MHCPILNVNNNVSIPGVPSTSRGRGKKKEAETSQECWIGHPLDPIGCLFTTLTDASVVRDETSTNTSQGTHFFEGITKSLNTTAHE